MLLKDVPLIFYIYVEVYYQKVFIKIQMVLANMLLVSFQGLLVLILLVIL